MHTPMCVATAREQHPLSWKQRGTSVRTAIPKAWIPGSRVTVKHRGLNVVPHVHPQRVLFRAVPALLLLSENQEQSVGMVLNHSALCCLVPFVQPGPAPLSQCPEVHLPVHPAAPGSALQGSPSQYIQSLQVPCTEVKFRSLAAPSLLYLPQHGQNAASGPSLRVISAQFQYLLPMLIMQSPENTVWL